jgi:hypothetical protein
MKNLYIIPTDKPSRLRYTYGNNYALSREYLSWRFAHHIYIIADEEILEGDWFYDDLAIPDSMKVKKLKSNLNSSIREDMIKSEEKLWLKRKKIILTTDQDLIADGVQAIDNIFLEWFVMNPKREYVYLDTIQISNNEFKRLIINYKPTEDKWKALENSSLDTPLITWDNDEETKQLYREIENLIMVWDLDGTKTAGSLTREIMSLIKKT